MLTPEQALELDRLVAASGLATSPAVVPDPPSAADSFSYSITVEAQGTYTVAVGELAMPPAVRSLVDFVRDVTNSMPTG
jgi:hypothetical protein